MNISTKQKQIHRQREKSCGCQGERWIGEGRNGMGVQDQQMPTIIYKMDKHGYTIQHQELYSIPCDKS